VSYTTLNCSNKCPTHRDIDTYMQDESIVQKQGANTRGRVLSLHITQTEWTTVEAHVAGGYSVVTW